MTQSDKPSIKRLEELADLLISKNLTRLDVSQGEQKIVLERKMPKQVSGQKQQFSYAHEIQTSAQAGGHEGIQAGIPVGIQTGIQDGIQTYAQTDIHAMCQDQSSFVGIQTQAIDKAAHLGIQSTQTLQEHALAGNSLASNAQLQSGQVQCQTEVGVVVRTPLLGIAYRAKEPGAKPFVELGTAVQAGDVLCLIEAMKMFNEITAPVAGEIADIMFADGDMVEHNAPLFSIT